MKESINRRTFLKQSSVIGTGLTVLPSGIIRAAQSPNDKLNIAIVGVAGRGGANLNGVKGENIAALCDVNANNLAKAANKYPNAKTYTDWRKCVDQKDIDAVVCSTTDHTHAFVNVWAMNRGKHVYCEKPLANSVHEAHTVRETYLKNKGKLATQMGTQIHATENFRRVVELIQGGAIGNVPPHRYLVAVGYGRGVLDRRRIELRPIRLLGDELRRFAGRIRPRAIVTENGVPFDELEKLGPAGRHHVRLVPLAIVPTVTKPTFERAMGRFRRQRLDKA